MSHWRKNHESDSPHLRAADLYDDKRSAAERRDVYASPIVEIEKMSVSHVKSAEKPRGERRNFAHFKGKSKPLGLNVTNCETLASISGSPNTDAWKGLVVQLYVDPQARYPSGKRGPAIRIRPRPAGGAVDTSPLADVPEDVRERLDQEQADALGEAREREPGEEG